MDGMHGPGVLTPGSDRHPTPHTASVMSPATSYFSHSPSLNTRLRKFSITSS